MSTVSEEKFQQGCFYSLKPEYVRDFNWSFDYESIKVNHGESFTVYAFDVDDIGVSIANGLRVAKHSERHMFKKLKSNLKPFKIGATYELRPECVNAFSFTPNIKKFLSGGERRSFQFTVNSLYGGDTAEWLYDGKTYFVAFGIERPLFKRIDNKPENNE